MDAPPPLSPQVLVDTPQPFPPQVDTSQPFPPRVLVGTPPPFPNRAVEQPLSILPVIQGKSAGASWKDDSPRLAKRVLVSAPPFSSNRVQPITDYSPAAWDGSTREITTNQPDLQSLRSLKAGNPTQANDHLYFSIALMFTCLICAIPSGGLTFIGAFCLLPAIICAAVVSFSFVSLLYHWCRSIGGTGCWCPPKIFILKFQTKYKLRVQLCYFMPTGSMNLFTSHFCPLQVTIRFH